MVTYPLRFPRRARRRAPTRTDKSREVPARRRYDRDLDTMQSVLETDFNASLGGLVMHYKECLLEEPKSRQEIGLAVLLHTSVRALSVQSVLRCGTKNAQSAVAARDYFEKRYPSSSPGKWRRGF